MSSNNLHLTHGRAGREQIEAQLLSELREAEAEFRHAATERRGAAEEKFREALRRFSELILEGRVPPGGSEPS